MQRIVLSTDDGARLTLVRYAPVGERVMDQPVLLQHGLGSNRFALDFPGRSLALYLSQCGFDVFVSELRGAGRSVAPQKTWTLDDYLYRDVPAVVDRVLAETGANELAWIGHSLGGILLMCHLMLQPEAPISRGLCVGSALHYRRGSSGFQKTSRLRPLLRRMKRIPYGHLMWLLSPVMHRDRFNFSPTNTEPAVIRHAHRTCFGWIPLALLRSLSSALEERGLHTDDGFYFNEETERMQTPVFLIGGTADRQAPPDTVLATADILGDGCSGVKLFGKKHGHAEDYGHFDLVIGKNARTEVWPFLQTWLRRGTR